MRIFTVRGGAAAVGGAVLACAATAPASDVQMVLRRQDRGLPRRPARGVFANLTKKFGFSCLDINSAGAFADSSNVDAAAPLAAKEMR